MPLMWRYLLTQYLKVLLLCTSALIVLLWLLRIEEIAHFITLGAAGMHVISFTLYQIPYILPIALPLSALISSLLLTQRLSRQNELIAFRAGGFSLWAVITPLLVGATLLAMANFYVVSELATTSHLAMSLIKSELRSINPLLLLSNKHLMKSKGIYFDTLGSSQVGEFAEDVVIAMSNQQGRRLNLLIVDRLKLSPLSFEGTGITLITPTAAETSQGQGEQLLIENIAESKTSLSDFAQLVQSKVWAINNDHLRTSLLLVRLAENRALMAREEAEGTPLNELKQRQRAINRLYSELVRRLSLAGAVITFTLLGACCGVTISRQPSRRGLIIILMMTALYLAAYFSAKGIDHLLLPSALFYLLPHFLMIITSITMLMRTESGVE